MRCKQVVQYIPRGFGHFVGMVVTMGLVTVAVTVSLELRVVAMDLTVMTMTAVFAMLCVVVVLAIQHASYADTDVLPMLLFFVVCVIVTHSVSRPGLGDSNIFIVMVIVFFAHDDGLIDTCTVAGLIMKAFIYLYQNDNFFKKNRQFRFL